MGDHTLTLSLTALSVLYVFYLTEHAGLRPALAGTVPLIGRVVDAVTDPLMGRLSDRTTLRAGRRRPWFLIGVLPFCASFAFLWAHPGFDSQAGLFAFYAGVYVLFSVCSTILTVPYIAILPEIAPDYDERSSLNAWRSALAMTGTLTAAVAFRPIAGLFGDGAHGFFLAGVVLGLWMIWPWLAIFAVTRERPEFQGRSATGILPGLRTLAAHESYRRVTGLYLCGRIAMDVTGMSLVFYFQYWMRRPGDFEIMFACFLIVAVLALPGWLWLANRMDKRTVFIAGALWWASIQLALYAARPEWPWILPMALAVSVAIGYGVVDLMPWSMLCDVVDEDELLTGERREGLYAGVFGFLRKLGGALGVWIAGIALDVGGFVPGAASQSEEALWVIRVITAAVPPLFLFSAAWIALGYRLGRERHDEIRRTLEERRGAGPGIPASV